MSPDPHLPASSPISVIQIDDGMEWRGGQHQVLLLVEGLEARGVEQRVLTPAGSPLAARLRQKSGLVVEYDGNLKHALRSLLKEFHARIIHAHRSSSHRRALAVHRRLRRKMKPSELPRLLTTRRVDFAIKRNFISRRTYRDPGQHYIAISIAVRDALLGGGVSPDRIDVVHSGVPTLDPAFILSRDLMRKEWGLGADEIAIGTVGALTDHKGHRYLIEAAPAVLKTFPKARFLIFGEGELRNELAERITRLHLGDAVLLEGYLPDARHKLAGLDVYVHPSHLEGLGTAILDAMLTGLPVVASAAGGIPDLVIEGETGLLAAPRNAEVLARRLIDILGMTSAERREIAERGRLAAETRFSANSMVEGTLAVYRKLLDRAP